MSTTGKRGRTSSPGGLDAATWAYLCDTPIDTDSWALIGMEHDVPVFTSGGRGAAELWREFGPLVLDWWVGERPGTRPSCWWRFEAPRWPRSHPLVIANPERWEAMQAWPDLRQRVGGTGTPEHELWSGANLFAFGLPLGWVTADHVASGFYAAHFPDAEITAVDPADPPVFEAQPTYLKRLGLLLRGEATRIPRYAFKAEAIDLAAC